MNTQDKVHVVYCWRMISVSYTHLDVYKRQIYNNVDFPQPDFPTIEVNSPFVIWKLTSSNTLTGKGSVKYFVIDCAIKTISFFILFASYDDDRVYLACFPGWKPTRQIGGHQ